MFNDNLISILVSSGVAIIPTDTIYGLVACAFNKSAVKKVYKLKNRAQNKPVIVLISKKEQIIDFGIDIKWLKKINKYWPGTNSLIFPTNNKDIGYLTGNKNSIALRLPNNKDLCKLIDKTGPLIAPSANPEGLLPAINIKEAKKYFDKSIDIYIDGGKIINNNPSKLIDIVTGKVLR